jgi:purine nucleoside phosphorylase
VEGFIKLDQIEEAAEAVRQGLAEMPRIGVILGSGLAGVADAVGSGVIMPYI